MASHELTLKNYQQQLKDQMKSIYENFTELLRSKNEHLNFEVQVRSAEVVRSYQSLIQLVADIRSFLIINDLVGLNQPNSPASQHSTGISYPPQQPTRSQNAGQAINIDEKLIRLRDEISMFLYELEIPLP